MTIRGEISDPFRAEGKVDRIVTVTVDVDVVAAHGKECLDLLLREAYDFSMRPSDPPF